MENEFVTSMQALALKELGFKYEKFYNYTFPMTNLCPLKQQVFRWFRVEYGLFYDIYPIFITASDKSGLRYKWDVFNYSFIESDSQIIGYLTYEEAENDCIDVLIELAKQQNVSQGEYDNIQDGN